MYIEHITFALGNRVVSLSDDEEYNGIAYFSKKNALIDAGFYLHRVYDSDQNAYDQALLALSKLQSKYNQLDFVDAILYATCLTLNGNLGSTASYLETKNVKHLMDFPISHLQVDFALDKAFLIGLYQTACASLLGPIRIAKGLLSSEDDLNAMLCLTADRFPEGAIYEQRYNVIYDGYAVCVVNKKEGTFKILACHQISNGAIASEKSFRKPYQEIEWCDEINKESYCFSYYNPAMYQDAGFSNSYAVYQSAYIAETAKFFRSTLNQHCLQGFYHTGIFQSSSESSI